jgi:hypothetical protein
MKVLLLLSLPSFRRGNDGWAGDDGEVHLRMVMAAATALGRSSIGTGRRMRVRVRRGLLRGTSSSRRRAQHGVRRASPTSLECGNWTVGCIHHDLKTIFEIHLHG